MAMNRDQILGLLAERQHEMAARYGVKQLTLFGSAARENQWGQFLTLHQ